MENDETFQTGVIREIKEETDVDFADDEIELIHAHTAYYQGKTSFLFLYIGYLKQQEVRLSNEHDEQYFMSLDEVLDQFKHPGWRHGIEYAAQHILA